jgi:uncharacterized SAM-binding protein YcdF (DUF218 family)
MADDLDAGYLFLRHPSERADVAVVFGHSDPGLSAVRARHGAKLFHERLAPMLVLSGGAVAGTTAEAEQMAAVCVEAGVPRERLLLERDSTNTFENVARSARLLAGEGLPADVHTALLVSCPWHMRRVYLTARQAFPEGVRFVCVPHEENCTESTWQDCPDCVLHVVKELALLERFVRAGLLHV